MNAPTSKAWRALLASAALAFSTGSQSQAWKPGDPLPAPKVIFGGALTPEADKFLAAVTNEFNEKQTALNSNWLSGQRRFDIDMQKALLRVQRASSTVVFDIQFAGSHEKERNTWEWAWNNPNVPSALAAASLKARAVGEKYQLRYATSGMVPVPDERLPLFLTALVSNAGGAIGAFRAPAGSLDYYFVLFNPRKAEP
jgi:hypothetical protein